MGIVITTLLFGIPLLIVGYLLIVQFDGLLPKPDGKLLCYWGGACALLIASTFVLEYPHFAINWQTAGPVYVVSRSADDGETRTHRVLPAWCMGDTKCYAVPSRGAWLTSHVKPITVNPKVRDLAYTVTAHVCDDAAFGATLASRGVSGDASAVYALIQELVRFQLYEFNNAHSVALGELYNPIDAVQNRRLRTLLERAIGPNLAADGLCFSLKSWDVQ